MKLNEYYVCDLNGYIIEKINANTLINITQQDGSTRWTLKNIDGGEVSRIEQDDETFCHHSCCRQLRSNPPEFPESDASGH